MWCNRFQHWRGLKSDQWSCHSYGSLCNTFLACNISFSEKFSKAQDMWYTLMTAIYFITRKGWKVSTYWCCNGYDSYCNTFFAFDIVLPSRNSLIFCLKQNASTLKRGESRHLSSILDQAFETYSYFRVLQLTFPQGSANCMLFNSILLLPMIWLLGCKEVEKKRLCRRCRCRQALQVNGWMPSLKEWMMGWDAAYW